MCSRDTRPNFTFFRRRFETAVANTTSTNVCWRNRIWQRKIITVYLALDSIGLHCERFPFFLLVYFASLFSSSVCFVALWKMKGKLKMLKKMRFFSCVRSDCSQFRWIFFSSNCFCLAVCMLLGKINWLEGKACNADDDNEISMWDFESRQSIEQIAPRLLCGIGATSNYKKKQYVKLKRARLFYVIAWMERVLHTRTKILFLNMAYMFEQFQE